MFLLPCYWSTLTNVNNIWRNCKYSGEELHFWKLSKSYKQIVNLTNCRGASFRMHRCEMWHQSNIKECFLMIFIISPLSASPFTQSWCSLINRCQWSHFLHNNMCKYVVGFPSRYGIRRAYYRYIKHPHQNEKLKQLNPLRGQQVNHRTHLQLSELWSPHRGRRLMTLWLCTEDWGEAHSY